MGELNLKANYFELFNLPIAYSIDELALKKNHLLLMQQVHPDRFVNASPQEQRLAVQYTGLINEALSTLRSPLKRAIYLLKLQGVQVDLEGHTFKDNAFLMEQINWREKIADANQDAPALKKVAQALLEQQQKIINQLTQLFANPNDTQLEQARELTLHLTFFERLLHEIKLKSYF